jgi:hypothetical protein
MTAVIANFQNQIAIFFGQSHVHLRRVRVPSDIGQPFLKKCERVC